MILHAKSDFIISQVRKDQIQSGIVQYGPMVQFEA